MTAFEYVLPAIPGVQEVGEQALFRLGLPLVDAPPSPKEDDG